MDITYSADPKELDAFVQVAATESKDGSVRIRVQPSIYRDGQYKPWPEVTWILRCETAEEAIAVKDVLRECFAALLRKGTDGLEGLEEVRGVLQAI